MRKLIILSLVIIFLTSSVIEPVVSATFTASSPTYTPWNLRGLNILVDSTGKIVSEETAEVLGRVTSRGSFLFERAATKAVAETVAEGLLSKGVRVLSKALGAGTIVVALLTPTELSIASVAPNICIDSNHDDFKTFADTCSKSATYKSTTPIKLRWDIVTESTKATTCSAFGSWEGNVPFGGKEILNSSKLPGKYYFLIGCEQVTSHSLLIDLITLDFFGFLKDFWTVITGGSLKESIVAFDGIEVDVVSGGSAPQPASTLSASLSATPSNLTLPTGGGSVITNLMATVGGTARGNVNYTFYCNRSDTGINITSPNNGKFDDVSNTSQPSSCSYSGSGVYKPKVIVERGNSRTQTQATVVVSQAFAPPPVFVPGLPFVDIKVE